MALTIKFIQNHLPGLKDGNYSIEVKHSFQVDGEDEETFSATKDFYVAGERFTINPQEILAVYPPSNGQSDFTLQPPYMAINRNTLPWERNVEDTDDYTPWLGLLMFTEDELSQITASTVTWLDVKNASVDPAFPGLDEEGGTSDTQQVQVIDVPVELLTPQLNSATDLSFLASARTSHGDDESYKVERAYLMSNRLPVDGKQHTVYLASFESRYVDGNFPIGTEQQVRLITLYSWSFKSAITYKVSASILSRITEISSDIIAKLDPVVGKVYNDTDSFTSELTTLLGDDFTTNEDLFLGAFNYGDYITTLEHTNRSPSTLRLLQNEDAQLEAFLSKGYTIIPHKLREGSQSVAFYRGPFLPFLNTDPQLSYPIMASDEVLSYYQDFGMFDISYASAWEMGRLITLEQSDIANALYQWKKGHSHNQKGQQQVSDNNTAHLPGALSANTSIPPLPDNVSNWFDELKLLQNVPFSYLIPDENLLPIESMRFFYVDNNWLEALIDGALAIGRTTSDDHKNDQEISDLINDVGSTSFSGVLIRSEVVAAWTDMLIDGFSSPPEAGDELGPISSDDQLKLLRMETLSPNIMLCIFEGDLFTLDIYGKPEAPNFGVEAKDDGSGFEKKLKDTDGVEQDTYLIDVPVDENNLIQISSFIEKISTFYEEKNQAFLWSADPLPTSAEFSVQMLEGGQKIRFVVS